MKEIGKPQEEKQVQPLSNGHQANPITSKKTYNRLYGGYKKTYKTFFQGTKNPLEIVSTFCSSMRYNKPIDDIIDNLHIVATRELGFDFTAIGLINNQSNCINFKLTDRIGNAYSSRILTSNIDNPIIDCFLNRNIKNVNGTNFTNISYINNYPGVIYPLISRGDCIGVYMAGATDLNKQNQETLSCLVNYLSLLIINKELSERVDFNSNFDSLTGLRTHRDFQECLSEEMHNAKENDEKVSVIMIDINNITAINKDYGHAKGDEVIAFVAEKLKQNIRKIDIASRYGGDELAIIMPGIENSRARYYAKYLNHEVSCSPIDDLGTIKLNIGISTYPDSSTEKNILLMMAEQATYISKFKKNHDGKTVVISANDVDFNNELTLDSFVDVMNKKKSQWGVNYEEELVNKFHKESLKDNNHMIDVVTSLAGAIDAKDPYTNNHSLSVARYAEALARALNLPTAEVERIKLGATLHDVGKIGIPGNILKKPDKLTDKEWDTMKQHPTIGAEKVLGPIESLRDLLPIVKHHHENWNGKGYPDGLKGEEIPLAARIVSVADAYHALISDRPYRKGMSVDKAIEILRMGADIQWDRELIRKFIIIAPSLSTKI